MDKKPEPPTAVDPSAPVVTGVPAVWSAMSASTSFILVLVLAFAFSAFAFAPFFGQLLFYPAGTLVSSTGFIIRSPVSDIFQVLYYVVVIEVAYVLGRRMNFRRDYAAMLIPAYFGAVLGFFAGVPGLQDTITSGGIFVFQSNVLDPTHIGSAFFNAAQLFGLMASGLALAYIFRQRESIPRESLGSLTSSSRLILLFVVAIIFVLLSYLLPPLSFYAVNVTLGSGAAASGAPYFLVVNSSDFAYPILFFILLYALGRKVNVMRDTVTIVLMLVMAVLVGSVIGNPLGSYLTGLISSGSAVLPNYFANTTILLTFVVELIAAAITGAFLGYAAIAIATTRRMKAAPVQRVPPAAPPKSA